MPASDTASATGDQRQRWVNILLAVGFTALASVEAWKSYRLGRFNYVEAAFFLQNIVMVSVILLRRPHKVLNSRLFDQAIALVAFCSGLAFMGQPQTGGPLAQTASQLVLFAANLLGIATLINLGRSFGILIAYRELKSTGLYGIVRHPMYASDILLRIGFMISHTNLLTVSVLIASSGCYVYRAILEERFLCQQPEYREYMARVRYRLIPGVF